MKSLKRTDKVALTHSIKTGILTSADDKLSMFKLRYEIYCLKKKWRPKNSGELETDSYDTSDTVYFGAFRAEDELVGCMRLIRRPATFMMEREFDGIVRNQSLLTCPAAAEFSRLAIREHGLSGKQSWQTNITMKLIKESYHYCLQNGIRYVYTAMFKKAMDGMRKRGFNLVRVAPLKQMSDRQVVEAAMIDWNSYPQADRAIGGNADNPCFTAA